MKNIQKYLENICENSRLGTGYVEMKNMIVFILKMLIDREGRNRQPGLHYCVKRNPGIPNSYEEPSKRLVGTSVCY